MAESSYAPGARVEVLDREEWRPGTVQPRPRPLRDGEYLVVLDDGDVILALAADVAEEATR